MAHKNKCKIVDVIVPNIPLPILSIPVLCLLVTLNLCMHYFYAITVPPGFLDDPPPDPQNSFLWARRVKDKGKQKMTGVRKGIKITSASTTQMSEMRKVQTRSEFFLNRYIFTEFIPQAKSTVKILIIRELTIVGYVINAYSSTQKFDHHCPVSKKGNSFLLFRPNFAPLFSVSTWVPYL